RRRLAHDLAGEPLRRRGRRDRPSDPAVRPEDGAVEDSPLVPSESQDSALRPEPKRATARPRRRREEMKMERLTPDTTALLVVDVQEKLAAVMPEEALSRLVRNTTILLEVAKLLGVAVIVSEQYP